MYLLPVLTFYKIFFKRETWRDLPKFNILKGFLQDIKDVFVNTPAQRRRYADHLKSMELHHHAKFRYLIHRMVFYAKEYIEYWPRFFKTELQDNAKNAKLAKILSILQDKQKRGVITIYIHFISIFSKEFVHTLDFFQQKNTPVFPFVELRLQHLDFYLQSNQISSNFGTSLEI